jgi:serralysin
MKIIGTSGNDILDGTPLADIVLGLSGDDSIDGGDGDDLLNGGADADTMTGGLGNDAYYVDDAGDEVVETSGGGADTLYTSVNYTLAADQEIERLWVWGTVGLTLTGNDLGNALFGGAGNDALNGGAGDDLLNGGTGVDTMTGGGGNDTYYVDNVGDRVVEASGAGNSDTIRTSIDYTLAAGQEIERLGVLGTAGLTLTGNELGNVLNGGVAGDTLNGGMGDDRLNGLQGADTMDGGAGNDIFYVDDAGDGVVEALGGGIDTVFTSMNFTLAAGQEIERLHARAGSTGLTLTGNELDNVLVGGAGDDVLDAGTGIDQILGRGGSDTMTTSGQSAVIFGDEGDDSILLNGTSTSTGLVDGGAGNDTVRSADIGQFVFRQVETLDTYYGFLNGSVNQIASFNAYTADLAASDAQISFFLRGAGGVLNFTAGIGGQNSIEIRDGGLTSAIRITGSVNGDTLFGSGFSDTLNGGDGSDRLLDGEGNDTLNGGSGADRLGGGTGKDLLTGGLGSDRFVFDTPIAGGTNIDRITDFAPGSDIIEINQENYFVGLTVGPLTVAQFAVDSYNGAGPQILYKTATGALYFDSNGAGAGGYSHFATLTGAPVLAASDFLIV